MKEHADLLQLFAELKIPQFRLKQLLNAVFRQGISDYEAISVFSGELKKTLSERLPILCITEVNRTVSSDGSTEKVAFRLATGELIEAVLMKYSDGRNSVCISSQAGCPMGCKFCATGTLKFSRNLTAEEITDQVLYFCSRLLQNKEQLTNLVFMGMGEPFLNYGQVMKAINILNNPDYFNLAARRMTVSTCGIIDGIEKFTAEKLQVNLAISLHSAFQATREKIMPVARMAGLDELLRSVERYCTKTHRRVSFEYVMLKGINDSEKDALELARISRNKLIHINLIPYNETGTNGIMGSDKKTISAFKNILQKAGVNVTVRITMGQDIAAACGQLANKLLTK
jgi:23S rRNA (adenine2503-C2)-methyltransferase